MRRLSGLIPAHAGKTYSRKRQANRSAAHPRSRGENIALTEVAVLPPGSSPLTRGKPSTVAHNTNPPRLIPAHAGKTCIAENAVLTVGAHPRSRGENCARIPTSISTRGSSPLTRGKPFPDATQPIEGGLIPAHAGKTRRRASPTGGRPAHPRSRGENISALPSSTRRMGSSPLTRGKRPQAGGAQQRWGLIPAHAGKTLRPSRNRHQLRAHPRSRGENRTGGQRTHLWDGSSPLTRGKLTHAVSERETEGLIPAHAGKTPDWRDPRRHRRAHPRSRGENPWA